MLTLFVLAAAAAAVSPSPSIAGQAARGAQCSALASAALPACIHSTTASGFCAIWASRAALSNVAAAAAYWLSPT